MTESRRFPVTPMQAAMLYDGLGESPEQAASGCSAYVSLLHFSLPQPLAPDFLAERWQALAAFYPVLRTRFGIDETGSLCQDFPQDCLPGCRVVPSQGREALDAFYAVQEGVNPFSGPLCRLILFKAGGRVREIGLVFHHAVLDGWSVNLILKQLIADRPPQGKAPPFTRYLGFLHKRDREQDLAYWRQRLSAVREATVLPSAFGHPGAGHRADMVFEVPGSETLHGLARELRMSAGRLLQAAWALLLCRYNNGQAVFGTVTAGRLGTVPGVMDMAGMCVNTIPSVVRPDESLSFAAWACQWNETAMADEGHGFASPAELKKLLPQGLSFTDALFVVDPPAQEGQPFLCQSHGGLAAGFIAGFEPGPVIRGNFSFDPACHDKTLVSQTAGHFCRMITQITSRPQIRLCDLEILSPWERAGLLGIVPLPEQPGPASLVDLFLRAGQAFPDRIALSGKGRRINYRDLVHSTQALARCLARAGAARGERVVLDLADPLSQVRAALAVLWTGAAYVPVAMEWPRHRIDQIIDQIAPALVLDQDRFDCWTTQGQALEDGEPALPCPEDTAYIIMTSGTTGTPKGVAISHKAAVRFCQWAMDRYDWGPSRAAAVQTRLAYDVAIWGIFPALFSGGRVHFLGEESRCDLLAIQDFIQKQEITHMDLPVAMAEEFMARFPGNAAPKSLKYLATGGDALQRYTPVPYTVVNEYGPTECTVSVTSCQVRAGMDPIPIGRPLPGMQALVLDPLDRLCPAGVAGALCFSGGQLAQGYFRDEEKTRKAFGNNPFFDPEQDDPELGRLYRTGDRARWRPDPDGTRGDLIFLGRLDTQVKIRGFRMETQEVVAVLQAHPAVVRAAAGVRELPSGIRTLCAWVVCRAFDEKEILTFLGQRLPHYMIPRLVPVPDFPLTPGGKVALDRLPVPDLSKAVVLAPETLAEKAIATRLAGMIPGWEPNMAQGFIEAGGDSIQAICLAARLGQDGWQVRVREIMARVTLRDLAATLVQEPGKTCLPPFDPEDSAPLPDRIPVLPTQEMLLTQSALSGPAAYAVTAHYRLARPPGQDRIQDRIRTRLATAVNRHDIFRLSFGQDGSGPFMVLSTPHPPRLAFRDLSHLTRDRQRQEIRTRQEALAARGIHPVSDPLFGLEIFDCGQDRLEFLVHYHHLILDGWSLQLLFQEIFGPEEPALPPVSFLRFALWAERAARDSGPDRFWDPFRRDKARPALLPPWPGEEAARVTLTLLAPDRFMACKALARQLGITPAAFFMALWNLVLDRFVPETDDRERLFGFVSSGRPPLPGAENILGMCARVLPLRVVSGADSGRQTPFAAIAQNLADQADAVQARFDLPPDLAGRLPRHLFSFESGMGGGQLPQLLSVLGEDGYDLVMAFKDEGETPLAFIRFNPGAVAPERAGQIADHFRAMAQRVLEDPDRPVQEISALPETEALSLTRDFGQGPALSIPFPTAVHAFLNAAETQKDCPALCWGTECISYGELGAQTARLARGLSRAGAGPGRVVGVVMERQSLGAAMALAVMRANAAYLPLDPAWPRDRVRQMLVQASAVLVVAQAVQETDFPVPCLSPAELEALADPATASGGPALSNPERANPELSGPELAGPALPGPDDPAYVICTSGTTGRPKATLLTHRALANQLAWTADRLAPGPGDKVLHAVAFSFDPSLWLLFAFWGAGACVDLCPMALTMDGAGLLQRFHDAQITLAALPARVARLLFDHVRGVMTDQAEDLFPDSLRALVLGGEVPSGLLPVKFDIINAYGPTEACIQATAFTLGPGTETSPVIGRPVANMQAYVLDRHQRLCPVGVPGELCFAGPQLAREYLGMPGETAAAFVPNPRSGSDGFRRIYRTRDQVLWQPDGNLRFLGRLDGQVKVRGHRVEPLEIEAMLRQAPGVADALVLAREDRESGRRLDAYFIPQGRGSHGAEKRAFMASRLPGFMVPASFTPVPAWPLTPNGKLDLGALPEPRLLDILSEPPRTREEQVLARAWEAVLNLSGIGREDNFFDLGGHSLLLLKVIGKISATHVLDLRDFFRFPKLKDLALALKPAGTGQAAAPLHRPQVDLAPPAFDLEAYREFTRGAGLLERERDLAQVMITGATGYLGAFLVKAYFDQAYLGRASFGRARLILPVRGHRPEKRILETLAFYFGPETANQMMDSRRIIPLAADLGDAGDVRALARAAAPDLILHSAAKVSHYGSLAEARRSNVTATQNMLDLAKTFPEAVFAHISTLSAVNLPCFGENVLATAIPPANLYSRTKHAAEQLVFEAGQQGMPILVFRTGNLILDTEHLKFPRAAATNLFLRLARMTAMTGLAPARAAEMGLTFVDQAAHAICLLAGRARLSHPVFHIDNPNRMTLAALLSMAGGPAIRPLPLSDLTPALAAMAREPDLAGAAEEYLAFLGQAAMERAQGEIFQADAKMDLTLNLLGRLGFAWGRPTASLAAGVLEQALALEHEKEAP